MKYYNFGNLKHNQGKSVRLNKLIKSQIKLHNLQTRSIKIAKFIIIAIASDKKNNHNNLMAKITKLHRMMKFIHNSNFKNKDKGKISNNSTYKTIV